MELHHCLNCTKTLKQTLGKRKKVFCSSTCRSNFWQKAKVAEKKRLQLEELLLLSKSDIKQQVIDITVSGVTISKVTKNNKKVKVERIDPESKQGKLVQAINEYPEFANDIEKMIWEEEQKYLKPKNK